MEGVPMGTTITFDGVLDAADKLSFEEQEALIEILHRRIIDRRRSESAKEIKDAEKEFHAGGCRPVFPDDLMGEILS